MSFQDFYLKDHINEGLEIMGFKIPTPIQQKAIPIIK